MNRKKLGKWGKWRTRYGWGVGLSLIRIHRNNIWEIRKMFGKILKCRKIVLNHYT